MALQALFSAIFIFFSQVFRFLKNTMSLEFSFFALVLNIRPNFEHLHNLRIANLIPSYTETCFI
jgi:hypothetical protein